MDRYSLGGLDGGRSGHDHKYTVNQYCSDDEEGKERVNQYVNGHTPYRVERIQNPHCVRRWKSEYVLSPTNDDEGLQVNRQTRLINALMRDSLTDISIDFVIDYWFLLLIIG